MAKNQNERPAPTYVTINCDDVVKVTDKAVCVLMPDGEEVWLPKSQMKNADKLEDGCGKVELEITEWIHGQKWPQ